MLILFLFFVFRSGSDRYYLKKSAGLRSDGRDVFYYLKPERIPSLVLFNLSLTAVKLFLFIFTQLPFFIGVLLLSVGQTFSREQLELLLFTLSVLLSHGIIFYFRLNSFLFVARYCFVSDNYNSLRNLFFFSYQCIKNNRKRVFTAKLSFSLWFISCVLIFPIGFVKSYYHQSMADIAADLIEKHLQKA